MPVILAIHQTFFDVLGSVDVSGAPAQAVAFRGHGLGRWQTTATSSGGRVSGARPWPVAFHWHQLRRSRFEGTALGGGKPRPPVQAVAFQGHGLGRWQTVATSSGGDVSRAWPWPVAFQGHQLRRWRFEGTALHRLTALLASGTVVPSSRPTAQGAVPGAAGRAGGAAGAVVAVVAVVAAGAGGPHRHIGHTVPAAKPLHRLTALLASGTAVPSVAQITPNGARGCAWCRRSSWWRWRCCCSC